MNTITPSSSQQNLSSIASSSTTINADEAALLRMKVSGKKKFHNCSSCNFCSSNKKEYDSHVASCGVIAPPLQSQMLQQYQYQQHGQAQSVMLPVVINSNQLVSGVGVIGGGLGTTYSVQLSPHDQQQQQQQQIVSFDGYGKGELYPSQIQIQSQSQVNSTDRLNPTDSLPLITLMQIDARLQPSTGGKGKKNKIWHLTWIAETRISSVLYDQQFSMLETAETVNSHSLSFVSSGTFLSNTVNSWLKFMKQKNFPQLVSALQKNNLLADNPKYKSKQLTEPIITICTHIGSTPSKSKYVTYIYKLVPNTSSVDAPLWASVKADNRPAAWYEMTYNDIIQIVNKIIAYGLKQQQNKQVHISNDDEILIQTKIIGALLKIESKHSSTIKVVRDEIRAQTLVEFSDYELERVRFK